MGTPGYMAPRATPGRFRWTFGSTSSRSAVLVHELAHRASPLRGRGRDATVLAHVLEPPVPRPSPRGVATAPPVSTPILERCLAKHSVDRYPETSKLAADLQVVLDDPSGVPQAGPTSLGPTEAPAKPQTALWWWQLHQIAVSIIHGLTLYPVWQIRDWLPDR